MRLQLSQLLSTRNRAPGCAPHSVKHELSCVDRYRSVRTLRVSAVVSAFQHATCYPYLPDSRATDASSAYFPQRACKLLVTALLWLLHSQGRHTAQCPVKRYLLQLKTPAIYFLLVRIRASYGHLVEKSSRLFLFSPPCAVTHHSRCTHHRNCAYQLLSVSATLVDSLPYVPTPSTLLYINSGYRSLLAAVPSLAFA